MFGKKLFPSSVIFFCFIAIVGIALVLRVLDRGPHRAVVKLGGEIVVAEVAGDARVRAQGLSGRDGLKPGTGMLFIFPASERSGIWMKDMKFSIDIIWIHQDRVVDIAARVPLPVPGQELPIYYPRDRATYVLEVPAGFAQGHGLKIGDPVETSI